MVHPGKHSQMARTVVGVNDAKAVSATAAPCSWTSPSAPTGGSASWAKAPRPRSRSRSSRTWRRTPASRSPTTCWPSCAWPRSRAKQPRRQRGSAALVLGFDLRRPGPVRREHRRADDAQAHHPQPAREGQAAAGLVVGAVSRTKLEVHLHQRRARHQRELPGAHRLHGTREQLAGHARHQPRSTARSWIRQVWKSTGRPRSTTSTRRTNSRRASWIARRPTDSQAAAPPASRSCSPARSTVTRPCVRHAISFQEDDLRARTQTGQWLDIQKAAATRAATARCSRARWARTGCILHSHRNVIRFNNAGSGANVEAARGLFMGAAAGGGLQQPGHRHAAPWFERPATTATRSSSPRAASSA